MNYKKQQKKEKKKRRVCDRFECIKSESWNEGDPAFAHEENCVSCGFRKCEWCGYMNDDGSCELEECSWM